ncbi:mandelate racemase/muconate lactonizing enzyme family protein [Halomarina oriensis]|uniref:o-succinylbenzoate synthase n=1 Tax=Halomarina oriensis TaxID=671145 RepID=A0A6B0GYL6_9EURY|nr:o-succinylbenzoate synthase [Halomarina oriensis]MWG36838.1 o-succinylbenzoate synthase [Halomarina oriensis]
MRLGFEPFSLPLVEPLGTANGELTEREGFVVVVEVAGQRGVGEATPLAGWTESLDQCASALARVSRFPDPRRALAPRGDEAFAGTPAARHGVALALADAAANRDRLPLSRWLGGAGGVEHVPVNATVGDGGVEATVTEATDAVAEGFDCLKVKVGARPLEEDVARLRAVREACPDVELRADCNGAWDRDTAREAVDALADCELAYLEQPLPATDVAGHADLRAYVAEVGGSVGVALDESLASTAPEVVVDAGAADVLVLKPMALGGVDRARTVALDAIERGVDVVVTTTIDAVYARTATVHLAASLPTVRACGLATADLLAADLTADPAPVSAGRIAVPEGKGNVPRSSTSDSA